MEMRYILFLIKGKALPFWIYGRDVTFIGNSMVMVESVRCKTWDSIETIIIDLEKEVYASLKGMVYRYFIYSWSNRVY